jgi:spore germination protein KC
VHRIKCRFLPVVICLLALPGCWSSHELTEWGLVQAAAVDGSDDGKIILTTQIYRPGGGASQDTPAQSDSSFIETRTLSATVQGASNDVALELGRKLQWSHTRVLLIGETTARSRNISSILDYFSRNHDLRGTNSLLITKGKASEYLSQKPLIENTMGQQLKSVEENAMRYTAKSMEVSLTDISVISKSQVPVFVIPYASMHKSSGAPVSIAGLAILQFPQGRMTGFIPPSDVPYVLMLLNRFQTGTLEIPCGEGQSGTDGFMAVKVKTKLSPAVNKEMVRLDAKVQISGKIEELACSRVVTAEEVKQFESRVQQTVEARLRQTIGLLKREKADVLGIGERIYRRHKTQWMQLKPDWGEKFSKMEVKLTVQVRLLNTGTDSGVPFPG